MSVSNGISRMESEAVATLQRCLANVWIALVLLARSSGKTPVRAWPLSPRDLAIAAGIFVAAILFLMVFVDVAVTRSVGHLPRWVGAVFVGITEFGESGWVLYPLGIVFILR